MYIWHASTAGSSCANCAQQQQQQSHQRRQQPYGRAQRTPRTAPPPQKNSQDHSCADMRIPAPNGVLGTEKAIRQASERLFARYQAQQERPPQPSEQASLLAEPVLVPARRAGTRTSPTSRLACSPSRHSYQPNEQASLLAEPALVPAQRAGSYQPSKRVSLLDGLVQVPSRRSGQPARQAGTCTSPAIRSTCSPSRCSCQLNETLACSPCRYSYQPNEQASLLAEPVLVPAQRVPARRSGQPARQAVTCTSPASRPTRLLDWCRYQLGKQLYWLAGLVQVTAWPARQTGACTSPVSRLTHLPTGALGVHTPAHRSSRRAELVDKGSWQAHSPACREPWRAGVQTCLPRTLGKHVCKQQLARSPWQACCSCPPRALASTAGINRSNTAARAVLEQPCSTGGRTDTVRPKREPTGRTDLSDRSRLVLCNRSQELIGQACPTRRQVLRSDNACPTTGRTRLFEHRSNCRV
ncbi:hypothetical protein PCANC_23899 [Puccinia coronata f. sp. avenae]|uniref:Uncharacterized protein n=1 Tax=Puccinia coronata f. sp. avenae TaxID=200324 RepID=A0A2N5U0A3_9BASI|nr:hypothetical protein PCANC_23899 [Puccinia coronata f. sp. avenae]